MSSRRIKVRRGSLHLPPKPHTDRVMPFSYVNLREHFRWGSTEYVKVSKWSAILASDAGRLREFHGDTLVTVVQTAPGQTTPVITFGILDSGSAFSWRGSTYIKASNNSAYLHGVGTVHAFRADTTVGIVIMTLPD